MQFISTRGAQAGGYSDALLAGLADDGGLLVPETLPQVSAAQLEAWRDLSYPQLAAEVLSLFAADIPRADLDRIVAAAYTAEKFGSDEIVPLKEIGDGITLVGLSEGPTLAFKDMAMQFIGEAMQFALEREGRVINIVGATSGDTGSAAEHALHGRERVAIFMLSPQGRMSAFQRAQMYSLLDDNVHNIAVDGVFDDCQLLVKKLNADLGFKSANHLGAVNSINFGRISAQIVYYVWAWLRFTDRLDAAERDGFPVDVTVPSGNFGNILSGYYAKNMGVPIRHLVLAVNENNVLDEFFRTGVYRPRASADTHATSSPSMDVSKASNLERFVFDVLGRDPERTAAAWNEVDETGSFDLSSEQARFADEYGIVSGTSTHADRLATIKAVFDRSGVVIDPHTADGVRVAQDHRDGDVPMLVLETALARKFPETVEEALGVAPEVSASDKELLAREQRVVPMDFDEAALRAYVTEHALR